MNILVVGGGLAGLRIAKKLGATLITDSKEFVFLPLLTDNINKDVDFTRNVLSSHSNTIFGRVEKVDFDKQHVFVGKKSYAYDILVLATGAKAALPVPGASEHAVSFYSINDLRALKASLPVKKIVIVGAGPTGVELAVELAAHTQCTLIQGHETILPTFSEKTQRYALSELKRKRVVVRTQELVERITKTHVVTQHGKVPFDVCVWCAGVQANPPETISAPKGIEVNEYFQVTGRKNVFAVGDVARSGNPLTAQAALQEADGVVYNVRRFMKGKSLKPVTYHHKGNMLALAEKGVLTVGPIHITGKLAAFIRRTYYSWVLRSY